MKHDWILIGLVSAGLVSGGIGCSKKDAGGRHLERARQYFEQKDWNSAEIEYLNVLRGDERNEEATRRLGEIYYDRNEGRQALTYLYRAHQLDPENLDTRLKLGMIFLGGQEYGRAREQAEAILAKDSGSHEAMLLLSDTAQSDALVSSTYDRLASLEGKARDGAAYKMAMGNLLMRMGRIDEAGDAFREAVALAPATSGPYLALGNLYKLERKVEEAGKAFRKAVELAENPDLARSKLVEFLLAQGDVEGAREQVLLMLKRDEQSLAGKRYLARIAMLQGRDEECRQLVEALLARENTDFDGLILKSQLAFRAKEVQEGKRVLEQLLTLYPRSAQIPLQLARVARLEGDLNQAGEYYQKALLISPRYGEAILGMAEVNLARRDLPGAITGLREFLRMAPDSVRAFLMLADAYRLRGTFDEALGIYASLEQKFPTNPEIPFLKGVTLLQQNQAEAARIAFEKALEIRPDYLPGLQQLVDMDLKGKDFEDAMRRLERVEGEAAVSGDLDFLRARILMESGREEEGVEGLKALLKKDPGYRPAYTSLAGYYLSSGRDGEALEELNRALKDKPDDVVTLMQVGMIHERRKNYEVAAEQYERLLKSDPKFGPALNNLAYLYTEHLPRLDRAFELGKQARELFPGDAFAMDTFGWILFKRGELEWALSLLKQCSDQMTEEPEVWYHLAATLDAMGDEKSALAAYRKSMELEKEYPGKESVMERLAFLDRVAQGGESLRGVLEERVRSQPRDLVARLRLAQIERMAGQFEAARKHLESGLAVFRSPALMVEMAELLAMDLGQVTQGMEQARAVRGKLADDASGAMRLVPVALKAGDPEWALGILGGLRLQGQGAGELGYWKAVSLFHLGKEDEAILELQSCLDQGGLTPETQSRASTLLSWWKEGVSAKGMDVEDELIMAWKKARLEELGGRNESAMTGYEAILGKFPKFAYARKRLAILHPELEKSYEMGIKAREVYPEDRELAIVLGKRAFEKKDYSWSSQLLKQGLGREEQDPEGLYYLGLVNYELKHSEEAKRLLKLALDRDGGHPLAARARDIVQE